MSQHHLLDAEEMSNNNNSLPELYGILDDEEIMATLRARLDVRAEELQVVKMQLGSYSERLKELIGTREEERLEAWGELYQHLGSEIQRLKLIIKVIKEQVTSIGAIVRSARRSQINTDYTSLPGSSAFHDRLQEASSFGSADDSMSSFTIPFQASEAAPATSPVATTTNQPLFYESADEPALLMFSDTAFPSQWQEGATASSVLPQIDGELDLDSDGTLEMEMDHLTHHTYQPGMFQDEQGWEEEASGHWEVYD